MRIPTGAPKPPDVNSYVYALWDEPDSEEPQGWYLPKVTLINQDGTANLMYRKGQLTKVVKLDNIKRCPT